MAQAVLNNDKSSIQERNNALEEVRAYDGDIMDLETETRIFDVLMAATQQEGRYNGGDDIPIISIKHSEDRDHADVIAELVVKITEIL